MFAQQLPRDEVNRREGRKTSAKRKKGVHRQRKKQPKRPTGDKRWNAFFSVLWLAGVLGGCWPAPGRPDADLEAPFVSTSSLPPADENRLCREVAPAVPIEVLFSEPLDAASVNPETVGIIEAAVARQCATDAECVAPGSEGTALCVEARCQLLGADADLVSLLDGAVGVSTADGTLTDSEMRLVEGKKLVIAPRGGTRPGFLYALVLASAVKDPSGNRLAGPQGIRGARVYRFTTAFTTADCPVIALRFPTDEGAAVVRNLAEVVVGVRSAAPLRESALAGVDLAASKAADESGGFLAYGSPATDLCPTPTDGFWRCYRFPLKRVLAANTTYRLQLSARAADPAGAGCVRLDHYGAPCFRTGAVQDFVAPQVTVDGPQRQGVCLSAQVLADEPVRVEAELRTLHDGELVLPRKMLSQHFRRHEVMFDLREIGPEWDSAGPLELHLRALDFAGHRAVQRVAAGVHSTVGPAVYITEVLANPAGKELDQEFVEIHNGSDEYVSLEGWVVADQLDGGGDLLPAETLAPGQFGLIVGQRYDPFDGADPQPEPDALILRLDSSLASNGLSNSGEPVYLFDAQGRLVSAYRPVGDGGADGVSIERVVPQPCGPATAWKPNEAQSATPGGPNSTW